MSKERLTAKQTFDKRYEYYRNMENKSPIPVQAREMIFDAMQSFAAQEVEAAIAETKKQRDELLKKQQEYIEAQDKQIKLITGDLPLVDAEGFGYHALAISQNLTKIERELNELRNH
jgi:hypothetical protein